MSKFVIMATTRRPTGGASSALCADHMHGSRQMLVYETYAEARAQADLFNRAAAQRGLRISYEVELQYDRRRPVVVPR